MTTYELQSIAFDMRKLGYSFEAIAEHLSLLAEKPVSVRYARLLYNAVDKRERM